MRFISWLLLIFVIFTELTYTDLPLTLIFILILAVMKRGEWIFILAFFAGIILDIFSLRSLGQTSIFFLLFVFLVLMYERKYEISTLPFVMITSFFGSFFYLLYIQIGVKLDYAITCALLGGVVFFTYTFYKQKKPVVSYKKL